MPSITYNSCYYQYKFYLHDSNNHYLLQLRHAWERAFSPLSTHAVFNRAVVMFFNCTFAPATNKNIFLLFIYSDTVGFNEVHSKARSILKDSRATMRWTRKRHTAFLLNKCFHRWANLLHAGRSILSHREAWFIGWRI